MSDKIRHQCPFCKRLVELTAENNIAGKTLKMLFVCLFVFLQVATLTKLMLLLFCV